MAGNGNGRVCHAVRLASTKRAKPFSHIAKNGDCERRALQHSTAKGHKLRPNGRHYARFDVNDATKRAKVALWAMRSGRVIRVYVIPLTHLRKVSSVYIPVKGKYAIGASNKPRKDWTRYEGAWHLLG